MRIFNTFEAHHGVIWQQMYEGKRQIHWNARRKTKEKQRAGGAHGFLMYVLNETTVAMKLTI